MKQDPVPTQPIDGEYITEWLVLGPFFPDDLDRDFLADAGGEASACPEEGGAVITEDGRTLTWKRYRSESDIVSFTNAIGMHRHATACAFCVLKSDVAGDAQFYVGSDDGIAVWINGEKAHHNGAFRTIKLDEDVFEAPLNVGINHCLVKLYNITEDWALAVRATMLSPDRAVLSGTICDEAGTPVSSAYIHLEQRGEEISETRTDDSGNYRLNVHPVHGAFDLSATSDDLGDWQLGIQLRKREHRTLNITLKQSISIEGGLLMLDDWTPHVAVPVQALRDGEVIDTALSNRRGIYRFINLKPGQYQLRCQIMGGCVYHGEERHREPENQRTGEPIGLRIEHGKTLKSIDFRFAPIKRGTWKSYTSLDGLAHNDVSAIYEDPKGVIWFGTKGGVSRYDGKEFTNFTTRDGLIHDCVTAIHCDPDGVMWFGTLGGASRYDGEEFINFTTDDGLVNDRIQAIHRANANELWFATYDGVSLYDGERFVTLTTDDGLPGSFMTAMNGGPDGTMWFGNTLGLSRYDGEHFVRFTTKDGLPHNYIISIHHDQNGMLWIGTFIGVARYDGERFVSFGTKDGLLVGGIEAIHSGPDGVMWFGTWGGASRYDGKTFVNLTREDGLGGNINAIHRSTDGTLWFAAQGGGISRYNADELVTFTTKDGLPSDRIHAIYPDPDGTMWIGTDAGVSQYDGSSFVNFTPGTDLISRINVIYREPDGVMWFGGRWQGVSRYDGRSIVNFTSDDVLPHNYVYAIHRSQDGAIWFGTGWATGGGATRYDGHKFVTLTAEDGLAGSTIYAICDGSEGDLWFGTDQGISHYDGKEFVNLTEKDGLVNNSVNAIHRDPDGVMWFGTWGGISRYDGKRFTNFTTNDGLAHDFITTIYRDPDGILWFGTDGGGICIYDGTAWSSLDTRDGLAGNIVEAIHRDPDGSMWFGTDGGLTHYYRNTTFPKVHIVSIITDQIYVDLSAIPEFLVGQRVTIEYSALDLKTVPEKRQYRCRIYEIRDARLETENIRRESPVSSPQSDVPYNSPTRRTTFDWTPEKPGEYVFEVQSISRDLNYSEHAMLSLTVQPDPVLVSMQTELSYLRREAEGKYHFESIIGRSDGIRQVRALMERAIDSGLTVLIFGETGTGKELVAKAIHYSSPRKDKPLLDRNCGAIPRELLASDLFGHRKGAFTGANEDKMGLFEAASGGTLLLDEISEMPVDAQVHLLRVLEERKVQRLGEYTSRDVDVRIIAMANRDLFREVETDRFREDLYYRLSEFPIHIPPLRERPEDISLLAEHFLQDIEKKLDGFAADVFEMLQSYPWPGNVRELRNAIRRAAALVEEGGRIRTYHFASQITHGESLVQEILSEQADYSESVDRFRRRLIEEALSESGGNRSEAARMLGMHRPNLVALIKRLGIDG